MPEERDPANFDFRIVALLTAMITRPDLLNEYLVDGKDKDHRGRPKALKDEDKWPRLRRFGFPPELLGEMLGVFEMANVPAAADHPDDHEMAGHDAKPLASQDIHTALVTVQRMFRTMVAIDFYCPDNCPDDSWFMDVVPYAGITTQSLGPAGVQIQE